MKVIDYFTGYAIEEVHDIEEGFRVIQSLEKEADMYGWKRPDLDIVDNKGNSLLETTEEYEIEEFNEDDL